MSAQPKHMRLPNEPKRSRVPTPTTKGPAVTATPRRRRLITPARLFFVATVALLIFGYRFPTERYISAQTGAGYVLGIVGGSSMLVLLLYPLRKRYRWLTFMGTTKHWFQSHMVLGIVGPLMILYHSNFRLGATNSNVALFCMLVVAGSGLFGRYFYSRIHHGLYGAKASLAEFQANAERLRSLGSGMTFSFLPDLIVRIDKEETAIARSCARTPILLRPLIAGWRSMIGRWRLKSYARRALHASKVDAERYANLYRNASAYIDNRFTATRRALEFDAYERLFSLWHVLHLPLFFMLVIAGVIHVVAVHVY